MMQIAPCIAQIAPQAPPLRLRLALVWPSLCAMLSLPLSVVCLIVAAGVALQVCLCLHRMSACRAAGCGDALAGGAQADSACTESAQARGRTACEMAALEARVLHESRCT